MAILINMLETILIPKIQENTHITYFRIKASPFAQRFRTFHSTCDIPAITTGFHMTYLYYGMSEGSIFYEVHGAKKHTTQGLLT